MHMHDDIPRMTDSRAPVALLSFALVVRLILCQLPVALGPAYRIPKALFVPLELLLLVCALCLERQRLADFFVTRDRAASHVLLGLCLGAVWCAADGLISHGFGQTFRTVQPSGVAILPLAIVVSILRSSLYEELLFRSLLMGYLVRRLQRPAAANGIQALAFLLAHLRYFDEQSWWIGLATLVNGLLWGWLTLRTKSVIPVVLIHGALNTWAVIFFPASQALPTLASSWL